MNASLANDSIRRLLPGMWQCYLDRLRIDPTLQGYLTLTATVQSSGFIASTSITGDLGDPALNQCVNALVNSWSLPSYPSQAATPSTVSIPVLFWLEPHQTTHEKRRKKQK